jgi:PAS domain-containing protein
MRKLHAKTRPCGLRALEASGQGFWELNLLDGSAWFSDWVCTRLCWDMEARPTTWAALRTALAPHDWDRVLVEMRAHLERRAPFDCEVSVEAAGATRRWRLRGEAERNELGQATYFSGGVQDVSDAHEAAAATRRELALLDQGFEALPVPAALVDAGGLILRSNGAWREHGVSETAVADYFAARSQAARHEAQAPQLQHRLRLRARPFEVEGARRLAVVPEET